MVGHKDYLTNTTLSLDKDFGSVWQMVIGRSCKRRLICKLLCQLFKPDVIEMFGKN